MVGIDKLDAKDPVRVKEEMKKKLPSAEAFYKQSERLNEIADGTKRSGADGLKPGGLILRPSGQKAVDEFQEKFLDTGKYSPSKAPTFDPTDFKGRGKPDDLPPLRIVQLPLDYCPDCEKEVPKGQGSFCVYPIFTSYPGLNLRPGDLFRHVLCQSCIKAAKSDTTNRMLTFHKGETIPMALVLKAKRMKRIVQNIEGFAVATHMSRRRGIFFDEYGTDIFARAD